MMISNADLRYQMQYGANALNIRGKSVVVLGEINNIGLTTAALLAGNGAPVFVAAPDMHALKVALAAIAQMGGEGDGIIVNLSKPEEVQRFFTQAEYWLGKVDAVVSFIAVDGKYASEVNQNLVMQESIRHLQSNRGQIITVNLNSGRKRLHHTPGRGSIRSTTAALRQQATESGIRVTLVQPAHQSFAELPVEEIPLCEEDVARCIIDSISQPYSADVVYLHGHFQEQMS